MSLGAIPVNRSFPFEVETEIQESNLLPETTFTAGRTGQLGTL